MHVLLIGSGGREHALAKALASSPRLSTLTIAPGNPGMASLGELLPISDIDHIRVWVRTQHIDLVVIGPEAPLAAGWADVFRADGYAVFGPSKSAARLESSKSFAKQLMQRVGVPTAAFRSFTSAKEAQAFVRSANTPYVVKADGLAAGKGVVVADSVDETLDAIQLVANTPAGQQILLEERLYGPEVSLIALCDGVHAWPLPSSRDHKRLLDGDEGPNTGGMGTISPLRAINYSTAQELVQRTITPILNVLQAHNMPFIGALYAGLILTEHGPKVIEYNARFGDSETQVMLPLCDGDMLIALYTAALGQLNDDTLQWSNRAAACIVVGSYGYPNLPRRGDPITINTERLPTDGYVLHAGTQLVNGQLVSAGGRVLNAVGIGTDMHSALRTAYEVVDCIQLHGMQYRLDIGQTELL
ncbi:MAG: phosphoribosylamine--glycine ligase [Chloroflexi bacterium]|nr:phosphoribosylamine--glycine ligase [Chloroflexota bacterium]